MKPWPLLIGIVVILAVVCSPALAVSMSDLIAQHQGQSAPTIPTGDIMDMLIVEDDRPVFPADPLTSLRSRIKYDEVYEDEVILVLHINERYNIYADRHGGNLHFNPVVMPGSSPGSSGVCSFEKFMKLMHYESGMVR